jgi:hypothetical protein
VLGVDLGGTSKEVLQEAASWEVPVTIVKNRMFGITFHPKLYLLRWPNRAEIIVGSSNFTDGGFYRNYEASSRTIYALPDDQHVLDKALSELKRFLRPVGPTAALLTPAYLNSLLAITDIPSEAVSRRIRAEGIPKRPPPGIFGYESIPAAPNLHGLVSPPAVITPLPAGEPARTDSFAIQVRAHHNGEIFLSVTAALQNPVFFNWPFNGHTTPKKAGNPSYPQISPDPVVDIVVFGAAPAPLLALSGYSLNTVYYETKSEIRITASPLVGVMTDSSIMIMRRSEAAERDYDIVIHCPDSPNYQRWLEACGQQMPGGGKEPRRFGWF